MHIDGKPLLHIVDEGTRFQAGRWLQNIGAKHSAAKVVLGLEVVAEDLVSCPFIRLQIRQLSKYLF
jgi:hypothetical protein